MCGRKVSSLGYADNIALIDTTLDVATSRVTVISQGGLKDSDMVINVTKTARGGNSVFVRGVGYFKNKGSNRGLPGSQQCVCSICVPGPDSCVPGQINQSEFF